MLKICFDLKVIVTAVLACACCWIGPDAVSQSLDFQNSIYYTSSGTTLVSSEATLSNFDFSSAPQSHPLFNDGLYYPVTDALGRNLWVRVRHTAVDPNGNDVGHNVPQTQSSPFRSGGFGGWGGFLYQFDIYRDGNLTGTRAETIGSSFRTSITVESIETLSFSEWVFFQIIEDPTVAWTLNSINFTGVNPASNPGFSGTNVPFTDNGFTADFPAASNTVCVIDLPDGGYAEFSMTAVGVSTFLYGYEYQSSGGYQGMTLSFGAVILLPTVTGFSPQSGGPGTEVTITGTNFSAQPSNNIVTFGGVPALVTASTPTTLTVLVPEGAQTGVISVVVDENIASTTTFFTVEMTEEPPLDIHVYNAVSPNGDGRNDFLLIANIAELPITRNNKVEIFNRWGDIVFTTNNYDNSSRVFTGLSSSGKKLPSGAYFYTIEMPDANRKLSGFIELKH